MLGPHPCAVMTAPGSWGWRRRLSAAAAAQPASSSPPHGDAAAAAPTRHLQRDPHQPRGRWPIWGRAATLRKAAGWGGKHSPPRHHWEGYTVLEGSAHWGHQAHIVLSSGRWKGQRSQIGQALLEISSRSNPGDQPHPNRKLKSATTTPVPPLSLGRQLLLSNRNWLERMQWLLGNPIPSLTCHLPAVPGSHNPMGERPRHPGSDR